MTQFIRLTLKDGRPILVNVAQIQDLMPGDSEGTHMTLDSGNSFPVEEPFTLIEANLRLMAHIAEMEATA